MDNLAFWDSVQMLATRSAILTQPTSSLPNLNQLEVPKSPIQITIDSPSTLSPKSNLTDEEKIYSDLTPEQKTKYRKKSAVEEMIKKKQTPNSERQRKKSLKERRNSTADLTLDLSVKLDGFHDLPITRQESVPKFYTSALPEYNPFAPTSALVSPTLPQTHTPQFDLKSVVQIENEIERTISTQTKRPNSKLDGAKRKMKLILIKKQASTRSLPDSINHI